MRLSLLAVQHAFIVLILACLVNSPVSAASSGTSVVTDNSQPQTISVVLAPGWNFISSPHAEIPVTVDATSCGRDSSGTNIVIIPAIYHYDPIIKVYKSLDKLTLMKPGYGYWVYLELGTGQQCTLKFSGTKKVLLQNLGELGDGVLKAGWNQIGGTTDTVKLNPAISDAQSKAYKGTCNIAAIYAYDSSAGKYFQQESISAGNSYWVYVENDCKLGVQEDQQPPQLPPLMAYTDPNNLYSISKPSDWTAELGKVIEVKSPEKNSGVIVWPIIKTGLSKGQNAEYIGKQLIIPFLKLYYDSFAIDSVYVNTDKSVLKVNANYKINGVATRTVIVIVSKPSDAVALLEGYSAVATDFDAKEPLLKNILQSYKTINSGELLRKTNANVLELVPIVDDDKYFTGFMPKGWKVAPHTLKLEADGKNCLTIPLIIYDPNNPANMIFFVPEVGPFYGTSEWREYDRTIRITSSYMGYFIARPLKPDADNPVAASTPNDLLLTGIPNLYHVPTDVTYNFDYPCELTPTLTPLNTCTYQAVTGLHYKVISYTNYPYYLIYPHIDAVQIKSTSPASDYNTLFGEVAANQFSTMTSSLGIQSAILNAEFTAYSNDADSYKSKTHTKATPAKGLFLVGVNKPFEYPIPFSPDLTPKKQQWYGSIKYISADKDQYAVLAPTLMQSLASIRFDNGYLGICNAIGQAKTNALLNSNKDFDAYIRGEEYMTDVNGNPYVGPLGTAADSAQHPENYPGGAPLIPISAANII